MTNKLNMISRSGVSFQDHDWSRLAMASNAIKYAWDIVADELPQTRLNVF